MAKHRYNYEKSQQRKRNGETVALVAAAITRVASWQNILLASNAQWHEGSHLAKNGAHKHRRRRRMRKISASLK